MTMLWILVNKNKGGIPIKMQEFTNESGIYKCTCLSNGRCYIGQARFLLKRKQHHIYSLRHNKHANTHMQRAWNKYGENSFIWEIVEFCDIDKLNDREIYWIEKYDTFNNDFNMTTGGDSNYSFSPKTLEERSVSIKNSWTDERRKKISESMLGENNPMFGRTGELNPAYGHDHSGEKNGMYGRHHTEEANEKNRQAHLGKNNICSKPIICVETNELFWSMGEAGRAKNCSDTTICKVCKGVKKTCGGYHWRYATPKDIELYDKNQNKTNNIAS